MLCWLIYYRTSEHISDQMMVFPREMEIVVGRTQCTKNAKYSAMKSQIMVHNPKENRISVILFSFFCFFASFEKLFNAICICMKVLSYSSRSAFQRGD